MVTSDGAEVKIDETTGEVESVEKAEEENELPTSQEFGYMIEQAQENAKAIEGFNETFSALNETLQEVLKNQENFAKRIDFIGKGLESPEAEDFTAEKTDARTTKNSFFDKISEQREAQAAKEAEKKETKI